MLLRARQDELPLPPQDLEDYRSKHLDLEQLRRRDGEDEDGQPLDCIDFDLLRRDEINLAYILALIARLKAAQDDGGGKRILDLMNDEATLRPKKDVIRAFLEERLPALGPDDDVRAAFAVYWSEARSKAFAELCVREGADPTRLEGLMQRMLFTGREPSTSEVIETSTAKPRLLERKGVIARLLNWDWPAARANGLGELLDAQPFSYCYLMRRKIDFTGKGSPPQRNAWFCWVRGWEGEPAFRFLDRPREAP